MLDFNEILKERKWLGKLMFHDIAGRLAIRRRELASTKIKEELPLDMKALETFPAPNISETTTINKGLGTVGTIALVIALSSTIAGVYLLPFYLNKKEVSPVIEPQIFLPSPVERQFIIRFRDREGNIIDVPQWKEK